VTNFKYYGELVDPELSNLNILTAGIGFRPKKKVSVDLIYHHYEQDVALDELRDSSLNEDPNGLDTDIGSEWDLVAGFTSHKNFQTELILGYFQPGAAFDDRREVLLFNAKFTYEF
jgi:alginate production protein